MDIEDPSTLIAYLRDTGRIGPVETPEIRVLRGGVSNRTVLVGRASGEQWVLKQALEKLRVQVEWLSSPARIRREAAGMRLLGELLPRDAVPELIFEDPQHYLLAMSAVPEPHRNWKSMLLAGELDTAHIRQFADLLLGLHQCHSDEARTTFGDTSFFESLRLEPYYEYTATRVPQAAAFLRNLVADTRRTKASIVHGDFSPKNILVHGDRLVLLDHEVIHFGDPAFDLGFSLTHLLSKAHHLSAHRAVFANAAALYWSRYSNMINDTQIEARAVRHTLACLLARVEGRSPLEYLNDDERDRQRTAVLEILPAPPARIPDLIAAFVLQLS
jgi:aminoglycoside phosphotransferase (APT) family kinase protein